MATLTMYGHREDRKDLSEDAAALIPEIVAAKQAKLDEFLQLHRTDVASFRFDCRRHGDFLAIFVTRGSHPRTSNLVAAANLMSSPGIVLVDGSPADLNGVVHFSRAYSAGVERVEEVYSGHAYPRGPRIVFAGQETGDPSQVIWASVGHDPLAGIHVRDAPRRAVDDRISFFKTCDLYVPYGCGADVFASIMEEVASVYSQSREGA